MMCNLSQVFFFHCAGFEPPHLSSLTPGPVMLHAAAVAIGAQGVR